MARFLRVHTVFMVIAAVAALILSSTAAAGKSRIVSGKVAGGARMTLLALAPDGTAVARRLRANGRFRLSLSLRQARNATLHLVRANGSYFGPVVLGRRARRAYVALTGHSTALGKVVLRENYAQPQKAIPARFMQRSIAAHTNRRGRPVGAGKLGFVKRSSRSAAIVAASAKDPGSDPDADAIPNAIDVDDNGNLKLDAVDTHTVSVNKGPVSTLFIEFQRGLNANASGVTRKLIDAVFVLPNTFKFEFYYGEQDFNGDVSGAHVDCFGLRYCRRGDGTAIITELNWADELPRGTPWVEWSPDGSGYPNLERITPPDGSKPGWAAAAEPRVPTSDIKPGDTMDVTFAVGGDDVTFPVVLSTFFVTAPAISSYSSGGSTTTPTYPIDSGTPGSAATNPAILDSERLTLTIWRPQRPGIPGAESAPFMDMGGLRYGVTPEIENEKPADGSEIGCKGYYSGLSSTLSEGSGSDYADRIWPLVDSASDGEPDSSRTMTFTVDLGSCLRAAGFNPAGKVVRLNVTSATRAEGWSDRAVLYFSVRMPS